MSRWGRRRVLGVDAARGVALLGMMAVHIVPPRDADGSTSLAFTLAAGRSSALFAVLAGVGLALLTQWTTTTTPHERRRDRVAIATRGALLVVIGLLLAEVDSGVAIILVYYGVLFVLVLPFLGLSVRALAMWAVGTALVAPVLSHVLRGSLPPPSYVVPTLDHLQASWTDALAELLLTGYYPAIPWMAYLFAGLAIGRLDLRSTRVASTLLAAGTALAVAAHAVSTVLLSRLDGTSTLSAQFPTLFGLPLQDALATGLYGTTPVGSWWWLAVVSPHTATPLDLAATIGSSMAVLGLALLVVRSPAWWSTPFIAVGGMTLSLYTLHILLLDDILPRTMPYAYAWQVVVVVSVALPWRRFVGQGPLEWVTQRLSQAVARLVARESTRPPRPQHLP